MSYIPVVDYNRYCLEKVQNNIRNNQIDKSKQCDLCGEFEAPIQAIDLPMRKKFAKGGHSKLEQLFSNDRVPISIVRWVDNNPHFGAEMDMEASGYYEYCPFKKKEIEVYSMYVYPDNGWTCEDTHLIHVYSTAEFFESAPVLEPCYLAQTGECEEWGCSLKWVKERYQSDGSHVVKIPAFSHADYLFKK